MNDYKMKKLKEWALWQREDAKLCIDICPSKLVSDIAYNQGWLDAIDGVLRILNDIEDSEND